MTPKYRPDIDGLRALAVLSVVFYHAGMSIFSGGFVGVDVFFTISGYLITSIIVREISDGTFNFAGFYERRFRRILPASIAMGLACAIVGVILLDPRSLHDLGKSLFANSIFSTNILFYTNTGGYFDGPTKLKPLLHTWSLSVEEQFYLFIPILLFAVRKYGRGSFGAWLAALAIGSFILSVAGMQTQPKATFFLLPTRAWELLMGGLVALFPMRQLTSRFAQEVFAATGMAMVLVSVFCYSDATLFPGIAAALPTLGTAILIYAGSHGPNITRSLLSLRPVVFIGLISYSLYLWHWPYIVFFKVLMILEPSALQNGLMFAVMLATAIASYYWIETPFRRKQLLGRRAPLLWAAVAASLVTAALGYGLTAAHGLPNRYGPLTSVGYDGPDSEWLRWKKCDAAETSNKTATRPCPIGAGRDAPTFMLFGDSHATALASAIHTNASERGLAGVLSTSSGCPPLLGVERSGQPSCLEYKQSVIDYLATTPSISTVFLVARWTVYAQGRLVANEAGNSVVLVDRLAGGPASDGSNLAAFDAGIRRTVQAILALGKNVVLVGTVPENGQDVPSAAIAAKLTGRDLNALIGVKQPDYRLRHRPVDEVFASLRASDSRVSVIDPTPILCPTDHCRVVLDGVPMYRDDDHLSTYGALALSPLFKPAFDQLAQTRPAPQAARP